MDKRLIILLKNHWFFRIRYIMFTSFLLVSVVISSYYYTFSEKIQTKAITSSDLSPIYNTWKVLKYYENGKLIVNNDRFSSLRLRINPDGTADWIKDGYENNIEFAISLHNDRVYANHHSTEGKEVIYEFNQNRLRFGKRDQMAHYEYVMVPWNYEKN